MSGTTAPERAGAGAQQLTRSQLFKLMQKLRQVTEPVVPPATVTVRLGLDAPPREAVLYGWAMDPRRGGGLRGLVRASAQHAAENGEDYLGWVRPDQVQPRSA